MFGFFVEFSEKRYWARSFGKHILGRPKGSGRHLVTTVDDRCRLFFNDFEFFDFSEKSYWARCFGKSFGSSEEVREGFLGHPGGVQEASWGVLGLSGGVRGACWEGLGRSWGDLGATLEAVRFRIVFLIDFERQKGAQREAFWEPKWS